MSNFVEIICMPSALCCFDSVATFSTSLIGGCIYAGAHTIGTTACFFMQKWLYNFSTTTPSDPAINLKFLFQLKRQCPFQGDLGKKNLLGSLNEQHIRPTISIQSQEGDCCSGIRRQANGRRHNQRGSGVLPKLSRIVRERFCAGDKGIFTH